MVLFLVFVVLVVVFFLSGFKIVNFFFKKIRFISEKSQFCENQTGIAMFKERFIENSP